jgi:hypothetical protein
MGLAQGIQARKQMFQEMLEAHKRARTRKRRERKRDKPGKWPRP